MWIKFLISFLCSAISDPFSTLLASFEIFTEKIICTLTLRYFFLLITNKCLKYCFDCSFWKGFFSVQKANSLATLLGSREIWPCVRPQAKNCLVWSKKDKVLALPNRHYKILLKCKGPKIKVDLNWYVDFYCKKLTCCCQVTFFVNETRTYEENIIKELWSELD